MVFVPLVVGVLLAGGAWIHLPLSLAWTFGYFGFFAAGLWLKARRKPKYFPPVRAYFLITAVFGGWVLLQQLWLAIWIPIFLPLLAVSLRCSHNRKDRSLLNDAVLVLATSLMIPVAYYAVHRGAGENWAGVWVAWFFVAAYFFGTVLYVKTVIRERGSPTYLAASIWYHWALAGLPLLLALLLPQVMGWMSAVFLSLFLAGLALRAVVVPSKKVTPKQLGIAEIYACAILTVALYLICS